MKHAWGKRKDPWWEWVPWREPGPRLNFGCATCSPCDLGQLSSSSVSFSFLTWERGILSVLRSVHGLLRTSNNDLETLSTGPGSGRLWRGLVNTWTRESQRLVSTPALTVHGQTGSPSQSGQLPNLSASPVEWGSWWDLHEDTATAEWDTSAGFLPVPRRVRPGFFPVQILFSMLVSVVVLQRDISWPTVVVCLCCLTKYHRLGGKTAGLQQQKFISHSLEVGSPRWRCWQVWFLQRPLSLTCRWWPSPHVVFPLCDHVPPLCPQQLLKRQWSDWIRDYPNGLIFSLSFLF